MSMFWTIWISVITLGLIIGCYFLLRWCLSNQTGVPEGESMGHEFDGIEELNNQLPRWWTIMFYMTIIWGFIYLALYPGLGYTNLVVRKTINVRCNNVDFVITQGFLE